jgi:hypothetical protein
MFRLGTLLQEQERAAGESRTESRCQVIAGMLRLRVQGFKGQFTRTDVFCVASCDACRVMMEDALIVVRDAVNAPVNAGQMRGDTRTNKVQCKFEK